MLTKKILSDDQLDILDPIIASRGWTPIDRTKVVAFTVFDDDTLIGFTLVQLFPLIGPMWVDKAHRGVGIAEDMAEDAAEFMAAQKSGFIVIADNPATVKLCETHGMKLVESPVFLM